MNLKLNRNNNKETKSWIIELKLRRRGIQTKTPIKFNCILLDSRFQIYLMIGIPIPFCFCFFRWSDRSNFNVLLESSIKLFFELRIRIGWKKINQKIDFSLVDIRIFSLESSHLVVFFIDEIGKSVLAFKETKKRFLCAFWNMWQRF